jgi:hypothetical protein
LFTSGIEPKENNVASSEAWEAPNASHKPGLGYAVPTYEVRTSPFWYIAWRILYGLGLLI